MPETIRDILSKFFATELSKEEMYLKVGRATNISLDDYTFTFTPNDESAPIEKCLLKSISNDTNGSFTIVPANNSFVLVAFTSPVTGVLIYAETADRILMSAVQGDINISTNFNISVDEDMTINVHTNCYVNANQTIFNQGNNQGLVKIQELTNKLNELVNEVNAMRNVFNSHTHSGVLSGPSSTGTPSATQGPISTFNKSDYENTDVKH